MNTIVENLLDKWFQERAEKAFQKFLEEGVKSGQLLTGTGASDPAVFPRMTQEEERIQHLRRLGQIYDVFTLP